MAARFRLCTTLLFALVFTTGCGTESTPTGDMGTLSPVLSTDEPLAPTPTRTPKPSYDVSLLSDVGGGMIAYVSNRDGDNEIYLMALPNEEGGTVVEYQLTQNDADDLLSSWSPDGGKIAFSSTRDGNWEIYIMDVGDPFQNGETGEAQRLTDDEGDDMLPAWSPDGSQIAFSSDRDGDYEIYVMDADGSNVCQLTDNTLIDSKPTWSPDGTKIGFDSGEGYNRSIYIMDADGSNQELVLEAQGGWPAWSPDGTQIAFSGRMDGNPNIYVVNIDGTELTRMTFINDFDWEPSWSPDGQWLLYSSGQVADTDIYVVSVDQRMRFQLTSDRYGDWVPLWRPASP
jgi:Tol biopolymer transport system component